MNRLVQMSILASLVAVMCLCTIIAYAANIAPNTMHMVEKSGIIPVRKILLFGILKPHEYAVYWLGKLEKSIVMTVVCWKPTSTVEISLCNVATGICQSVTCFGRYCLTTFKAWSKGYYEFIITNLGNTTIVYRGLLLIIPIKHIPLKTPQLT